MKLTLLLNGEELSGFEKPFCPLRAEDPVAAESSAECVVIAAGDFAPEAEVEGAVEAVAG